MKDTISVKKSIHWLCDIFPVKSQVDTLATDKVFCIWAVFIAKVFVSSLDRIFQFYLSPPNCNWLCSWFAIIYLLGMVHNWYKIRLLTNTIFINLAKFFGFPFIFNVLWCNYNIWTQDLAFTLSKFKRINRKG